MKKIFSDKKIHYGWVIVFVGFLLMWFISCIFSNSTGMMVKPVSESMNISRSQFSLASTFTLGAGMIMSMKASKFYNTIGLKRTMLLGVIIFARCYVGMGFAPNIYYFYVLSFISGLAMTAACSIAVSTLISTWFAEKRGLAIALASTGTGVGGVIMNPVISNLITNNGWQKTYIILGIIIAATLVPVVALLVKEKPADVGLQPYGLNEEMKKEQSINTTEGITLSNAKKSSVYWMWIVICAFVSMGCNCLQHTVPFVSDLGFSRETVALIASILTAGIAIGKIIMGQVFDTLGSRKGGTLSLAIFAFSQILYTIANVNNPLPIYIAVAIFGMGGAFATVAITIITEDLFGKKEFPAIYGNISVFISLGGAIGSPLVAAIYDTVGTYKPAWLGLAIVMFFNILLLNTIYAKKQAKESGI